MENREKVVPFGLLFEEAAPAPGDTLVPTYDEETDLSYVKDLQGHWVPYVEFSGVLGTQTETKVQHETTDTDPEDDRASRSFTGIQAITTARTKSTDYDRPESDVHSCGNLGTETVTLVRSESTDTDPEDDHSYHPISRPLMGTDTITEAEGEPTDQD
jgi:hypothetical protein